MQTKITEEEIIDVGYLKEKEKVKVIFQLNYENIESLKPGCSCTSIEEKDGNIIAVYDNGTIPYHLKHLKEIPFAKHVTVIFKDKKEKRLLIKGHKIK